MIQELPCGVVPTLSTEKSIKFLEKIMNDIIIFVKKEYPSSKMAKATPVIMFEKMAGSEMSIVFFKNYVTYGGPSVLSFYLMQELQKNDMMNGIFNYISTHYEKEITTGKIKILDGRECCFPSYLINITDGTCNKNEIDKRAKYYKKMEVDHSKLIEQTFSYSLSEDAKKYGYKGRYEMFGEKIFTLYPMIHSFYLNTIKFELSYENEKKYLPIVMKMLRIAITQYKSKQNEFAEWIYNSLYYDDWSDEKPRSIQDIIPLLKYPTFVWIDLYNNGEDDSITFGVDCGRYLDDDHAVSLECTFKNGTIYNWDMHIDG